MRAGIKSALPYPGEDLRELSWYFPDLLGMCRMLLASYWTQIVSNWWWPLCVDPIYGISKSKTWHATFNQWFEFNSKHGLLRRPHFALTQSTASRSWAIYSPLLRCHKLRQRKTWHASYMPWVEFNSNHGLSQFNISKIASISGITSWIELTQNYVWMSRGSGFLNQVITVSSTLSLYWNKPSQSERNLKFNFAHNKHHLLNYLPSYHSIYTEWGSPSSN